MRETIQSVKEYGVIIPAIVRPREEGGYERLSRDDNLEGESYSIGNQKKLLTKVAKEKGYTNLVHFLTMAFPASRWTALVLWR